MIRTLPLPSKTAEWYMRAATMGPSRGERAGGRIVQLRGGDTLIWGLVVLPAGDQDPTVRKERRRVGTRGVVKSPVAVKAPVDGS